MQICDNCMTPAKGHGDIRRIETVEAMPFPPLTPESSTEPIVSSVSELCETCRGSLYARDYGALASSKRISTLKRQRKTAEGALTEAQS